MAKSKITLERLKEVLSYDPENGLFTWRKRMSQAVRAGDIAGNGTTEGYIQIGIDGMRSIRAHRLIWFYVTGNWPKHQIDHIDGCKINNRFENLREVTHSGNQQNIQHARCTNRTGLIGVFITPSCVSKPFRSVINANGKKHHLGYFKSAEEAHAAYVAAKRRLHPFNTL